MPRQTGAAPETGDAAISASAASMSARFASCVRTMTRAKPSAAAPRCTAAEIETPCFEKAPVAEASEPGASLSERRA